MGYLKGIKEYCWDHYRHSIFDDLQESQDTWAFHLHGNRLIKAKVLDNMKFEVKLGIEGESEETIHKTQVKLAYPVEHTKDVKKQIKEDKKVKNKGLEAIYRIRGRNFIKNKTLYPLMKEREVLFFTLLEGDLVRGVVIDFSKYEIKVGLKGGIPVIVLRHAIHDLRNKKGRCFLKSAQEKHKDWLKSDLYMEGHPPADPEKPGADTVEPAEKDAGKEKADD